MYPKKVCSRVYDYLSYISAIRIQFVEKFRIDYVYCQDDFIYVKTIIAS